MKYLQKLGKSLMLPVSVLPVAAILSGIGYWILNTAGENFVQAFFTAAGGALLDNLPLLFALGLAKSEPWALGVLIAACLLALACLFVLRKPAP